MLIINTTPGPYGLRLLLPDAEARSFLIPRGGSVEIDDDLYAHNFGILKALKLAGFVTYEDESPGGGGSWTKYIITYADFRDAALVQENELFITVPYAVYTNYCFEVVTLFDVPFGTGLDINFRADGVQILGLQAQIPPSTVAGGNSGTVGLFSYAPISVSVQANSSTVNLDTITQGEVHVWLLSQPLV